MAIGENLTTFAGRAVKDWSADNGIKDPAGVAYRLGITYDEGEEGIDLPGKLAEFLDDPKAAQVEALVIGAWQADDSSASSAPLVEALAAARDKLKSLRHLFLGDITSEENEMSWIVQSDLSPLLEAYPNLEHLSVRGSQDLSLGSPRHAKLRELVIQSGGLPPGVVHEIAAAELPALEHLELWLGSPGYGGDTTVEDLAPLLKGDRFPRLKYLGLKNSEIQDDIAAVIANAPVLERIEVLDLSLGTLGDDGAKALLASPVLSGDPALFSGKTAAPRLKKLDIHHHYVSDDFVKALKKLGIEVDAGEKQEPDNWGGEEHRYISVSE